MIVITRHVGEEVIIGNPVAPLGTIRIAAIKGDRVRIGFEFPEGMVHQSEMAKEIVEEQRRLGVVSDTRRCGTGHERFQLYGDDLLEAFGHEIQQLSTSLEALRSRCSVLLENQRRRMDAVAAAPEATREELRRRISLLAELQQHLQTLDSAPPDGTRDELQRLLDSACKDLRVQEVLVDGRARKLMLEDEEAHQLQERSAEAMRQREVLRMGLVRLLKFVPGVFDDPPPQG